MKRGPKPTPTSLKVLKGTRPDRIPRDEPTPPEGMPDPPGYLDERGLGQWRELAPILYQMGLLTEADGMALGLLCHSFSQWRQAEEKLQAEGPTVPAPRGGVVTNPWVRISRAARESYLRLLCEFGCTPSSRAGLKVTPPAGEPQDELDKFLARARERREGPRGPA
jgi:P27 family predicted phage terminase small subunit